MFIQISSRTYVEFICLSDRYVVSIEESYNLYWRNIKVMSMKFDFLIVISINSISLQLLTSSVSTEKYRISLVSNKFCSWIFVWSVMFLGKRIIRRFIVVLHISIISSCDDLKKKAQKCLSYMLLQHQLTVYSTNCLICKTLSKHRNALHEILALVERSSVIIVCEVPLVDDIHAPDGCHYAGWTLKCLLDRSLLWFVVVESVSKSHSNRHILWILHIYTMSILYLKKKKT